MSAPCPSPLADVVKIVEAMKARKQLVPRLRLDSESVSASVLQTARTATEPTAMAGSLPPVVAVAVNPATQTNEPSVVVSSDALYQIMKRT